MKLFAVYVGGEHPRANIEVHDVRFVVAASITETYAQLRTEWWGKPGTLHVDCWAEISHADGYVVSLKREPSTTREKLYFVNLGGYDGEEFAERHKNLFVIATSTEEAKAKSLGKIAKWKNPHRDDLYEAEHAFLLDTLLGGNLHIHLTPGSEPAGPRFTCRFTPLK